MKPVTIAYIILTLVLVATFLSIFFFTYVSQVEKKIIQQQIQNVMDDTIGNLNLFLTEEQKQLLVNEVSKLPSDMPEADQQVLDNNKKLFKQTLLTFSIIFVIGIMAVLLLWMIYRFPIQHVVIPSLIMFTVVALTDFCFATFISQNYQLVDGNYVKYVIIQNLKQYAHK